ncbi:hypothetical protein RRG08_023394 [Elysia crispata]|uniref:Uncharacterized protein n=1 Tax=Elysia crispata TaxID=231223 RepID=A0AAE0YEE1_9GAST|nr:hypothetical protein RRG08_023394 [Elysia crispata]
MWKLDLGPGRGPGDKTQSTGMSGMPVQGPWFVILLSNSMLHNQTWADSLESGRVLTRHNLIVFMTHTCI